MKIHCQKCGEFIPENHAMMTLKVTEGYEFTCLGCEHPSTINNLYEVSHEFVKHWVIAISGDRACKVVIESDDCEYDEDYEINAERMSEPSMKGKLFMIDGEEGNCPIWFAYLIARHGGEQILACSEW